MMLRPVFLALMAALLISMCEGQRDDLPCDMSEFGCCPDGLTSSLDKLQETCNAGKLFFTQVRIYKSYSH